MTQQKTGATPQHDSSSASSASELLFEKVKRNYPGLVNGIMKYHQQNIEDRAKRRKKRATHVTLMEIVINNFSTDTNENGQYADFCVNAMHAVFLTL